MQRLPGFAAFFLPVILHFFNVGAIDGIGIAVDTLLDAATGAAGAAAFIFFFFVLLVVGGTMGGEGRVHDDDDLDLVVGSLCYVRYRQQQRDMRRCRGSGNCGGGCGPTFGIGKDDRVKEEREGVDNGDKAQHMTRHKKLPGCAIFYEHV